MALSSFELLLAKTEYLVGKDQLDFYSKGLVSLISNGNEMEKLERYFSYVHKMFGLVAGFLLAMLIKVNGESFNWEFNSDFG